MHKTCKQVPTTCLCLLSFCVCACGVVWWAWVWCGACLRACVCVLLEHLWSETFLSKLDDSISIIIRMAVRLRLHLYWQCLQVESPWHLEPWGHVLWHSGTDKPVTTTDRVAAKNQGVVKITTLTNDALHCSPKVLSHLKNFT